MRGEVLLGIDNSTDVLCLGLAFRDTFLEGKIVKGKRASEILAKEVLNILKNHGYSLKDVGKIVYTSGPGSYTGLRVALSFLKGLNIFNDIVCIPISTLDVLSSPFYFLKGYYLCPIIDAKKSEVFFALYEPDGFEVKKITEIECIKIERIGEFIKGPTLFFGNGVRAYKGFLKEIKDAFLIEEGFSNPDPFFLIREGLKRKEGSALRIFYGKRSDAEIKSGLEIS